MLSRRFLRIKVVKALYTHLKSESVSVDTSEKNLVYALNKSYDLYFLMLSLICDVAHYAAQRIEIARNKHLATEQEKNPNLRMLSNRAIELIEGCEELQSILKSRSLGWSVSPETVKTLYRQLTESEFYKKYMELTASNFRTDARFVQDFYINIVQDNAAVETALEEQSIYWSDDLDFALIMVIRTLENASAKSDTLALLPQYKSDDDLDFATSLLRYSIVNYNSSLEYIEKFTRNWDVERIAFMDNVIMVTAMSEIILFDSIPVKVTLDEYIEIAKYYSTPTSSVFINGILDKVVDSLNQDGRITKRGRGLL